MRNYGTKPKTQQTQDRVENKTYTFFEKQDEILANYKDLLAFIEQGTEAEGRDPLTALPNYLSFLLVLHTSGKKVKDDTLFDAWEVALGNHKVPSEECSRYAWGVLKKMTEKAA